MKTKTISSFDEYLQYTESYKGQFYFRGQADSNWEITPSISRDRMMPSLNEERIAIYDVINNSEEKLSPFFRMSNQLKALFYMQHYGKKTRICDLTISNLCALFFASEGNSDGAVFVIDKSTAVEANGLEMQSISQTLTINDATTLELNEPDDVKRILTRNYVVKDEDMLFSNTRSFLQGGTGIVFGFGYDSTGFLCGLGNLDVSDLIIEKIVIDKSVKNDIRQELRTLGYAMELLHGISDVNYLLEAVTLVQTDLEVTRKMDFQKINAKYRVSSIYFDRDTLAIQISDLYKQLFAQYGSNARIWTFFYFDDDDVANINWICRGSWQEATQFNIVWTKDYHSQRLYNKNKEISSSYAIEFALSLVDEITPSYERIQKYVSRHDFDLVGLFDLMAIIQPNVRAVFNKANDRFSSDIDTEKFVEKLMRYINDIDWIVGDMLIFSKRPDMKEQTLRWMLERIYLTACAKSCKECFDAIQARKVG